MFLRQLSLQCDFGGTETWRSMQLWAKKLMRPEKKALKKLVILTKKNLNLNASPEGRPILHLRDVKEDVRAFVKDPVIKLLGECLDYFNAYRNAVDRQTSEIKTSCVEMLQIRLSYLQDRDIDEGKELVAERKRQQQAEIDHERSLRNQSPTRQAVSVVFKG